MPEPLEPLNNLLLVVLQAISCHYAASDCEFITGTDRLSSNMQKEFDEWVGEKLGKRGQIDYRVSVLFTTRQLFGSKMLQKNS